MNKRGGKQPTPKDRAKAILDSATLNDDDICKKYSISKRTWQRWLAKFRTGGCPELTKAVADKKCEQDAAWGRTIPEALDACLDFITRAARGGKVDDPDTIHAVAGAMKMVVETDATRKYIDARICGQDSGDGAKGQSVPPTSNVTPIRRAQ